MLRDEGDGAGGAFAELSDDELADEVTTLAAHLSAAMCRWLALVAAVDERRVWARWGCASCAHWLSWRCSIAPKTAREHVRVARRLAELPLVRERFARGELSFSKVRALTRLTDIRDEDGVVALGLAHTAAQLERVVRATRRVTRDEAADQHDLRHLVLEPADDGSVLVRGRLSAEDGALLARALDLAATTMWEQGVPDGTTAPMVLADALVLLATSTLASGAQGLPSAERHEVVVHVDANSATSPTIGEDTPISAETARRLCCDAGIVVSLERGGEPLAVGRRTRSIPPAVRRALRSRGERCGFPGCEHTRWLDAHHVVHWADGGPTDLDNLVLLCGHHHRLVHEHGYAVEGFRGSLTFRTPHGRPIDPHPTPPPGAADAVPATNAAHDVHPDPHTALPGWRGESFHLRWSVEALLGRLSRAAAGTPRAPRTSRASPA